MKDIKRHIKNFFLNKDSGEGYRVLNRWYHFFDNSPNQLEEMDAGEKEELRVSLFENIRIAARISEKRIHWIGSGLRNKNKTWHYKMAAGFSVLLLAVLPVFLFTVQDPGSESVMIRTSSNAAGQSSEIRLADGSVIWLSANSTLEYPDRFDSDYREVILSGEAFFDVAHNPQQPFIVKSGDLHTRVLGTSFNIRAFTEEKDIAITVVTGRVSVNKMDALTNYETMINDHAVLLDPDQQFLYNNASKEGLIQTVNPEHYTSWKKGLLSFEKHTFEEIAQRLEQWYGVEIHFEDPKLKESHLRITFENNSLEHVLRMLQAIKDFEFEIEGRQIWIR
ncbi:MAG: FecR domain-containing protein [Bacteroidales bacterium]